MLVKLSTEQTINFVRRMEINDFNYPVRTQFIYNAIKEQQN